MDASSMSGPKLLLYHDLTRRGSISAQTASARFDAQLAAIVSAGYRFRSMPEYLAGELGSRDVVVTFDDALRSFADVAWPVLRRHGVLPALFVVTEFASRTDADHTLMNWDDVHSVAEQGATIGCHAASHVPLNQIPPEAMRDEIARSLMAFEDQGFSPETIAYPFGRFDAAVKSAVEDAGFEAAFTVMNGGADRFEIRRRLLTGAENTAQLRFVLSDGFFGLRDGVRAMVPRRFLKQEQPVATSRWGARALGLSEFEPLAR